MSLLEPEIAHSAALYLLHDQFYNQIRLVSIKFERYLTML